tara:strand:- start:55 stop:1098 length:1044 start_codon:yes stop_codon:yes gene_type:complete
MTSTTIQTQGFLCEYWRPEHCDPENWIYEPSTYGVEGVELVGDKHMVKWSDLNGHFVNPGRKEGINYSRVQELKDRIKEDGIDTNGSVIYYDVDTNERINCAHRNTLSDDLKIKGWMGQGVRFSNLGSKIRFATKSNNRKGLIHNNTSIDDVECAVRELMNVEVKYTEDYIKEQVNDIGNHLTKKQNRKISESLIMEVRLNNKTISHDRYHYYNDDLVKKLLGKIDDPWVKHYWENEDEVTYYLNAGNFESRVGPLLSANKEAVDQEKPLHLIFSVSINNLGKDSVQDRRDNVFNKQIRFLENRILGTFDFGEKQRKQFAWNHPECEHRTVAQKTPENTKELIKVKR